MTLRQTKIGLMGSKPRRYISRILPLRFDLNFKIYTIRSEIKNSCAKLFTIFAINCSSNNFFKLLTVTNNLYLTVIIGVLCIVNDIGIDEPLFILLNSLNTLFLKIRAVLIDTVPRFNNGISLSKRLRRYRLNILTSSERFPPHYKIVEEGFIGLLHIREKPYCVRIACLHLEDVT